MRNYKESDENYSGNVIVVIRIWKGVLKKGGYKNED